jgi:hypothetical protein
LVKTATIVAFHQVWAITVPPQGNTSGRFGALVYVSISLSIYIHAYIHIYIVGSIMWYASKITSYKGLLESFNTIVFL